MLAESQSWVRPADAIGFGRQTVESLNSRNRVAMLLQPSSVLRTAMSSRGRFSLAPQMLVRRWNAPDEIQLETECIAEREIHQTWPRLQLRSKIAVFGR